MKSKLFLVLGLIGAVSSLANADNVSSIPNQVTASTSVTSAPFPGSYSGVAHMLQSGQDYNCQLITQLVTVATAADGTKQQVLVGALSFSVLNNAPISDASNLSDLISSTGGLAEVSFTDGSYDATTHQVSLRASINGTINSTVELIGTVENGHFQGNWISSATGVVARVDLIQSNK
jgi:hypothetical protein